ncbi:hypothetical protein ACS0TY_006557 [Phlomoides rotata]
MKSNSRILNAIYMYMCVIIIILIFIKCFDTRIKCISSNALIQESSVSSLNVLK